MLACEQALLFRQAKRVSQERTTHELAAKPRGAEERPPPPRSRVIARLASLAQIEELARRLRHTSGGVAK